MGGLKLAVFASGRGSNFESLITAARRGHLHAEFRLLIVNSPEAGALHVAHQYKIPSVVIERKGFASRDAFIGAMRDALLQADVEWIVLAGYLKKMPPEIIRLYPQHIVNIHPGLLPAFGGEGMYGRRVHQAVLEAGCKVSGVTVHLVDDHYDHGPILAQQCVPVLPGDSVDALAARVLALEHVLYAETLQALAENRLIAQDAIAWIAPKP